VTVDELIEDNKHLFRDSSSEARSEHRALERWLTWTKSQLWCDCPCWIYCFCLNPLRCVRHCESVILNWFAILAALTIVSLYYKSFWLELFSEYNGHFMVLGLACFYTVIKLCHHMHTIENMTNSLKCDLDSSIMKMILTEQEVGTMISKIVKARYEWYDCLDDLQSKNKEIRVVGRRLDHRKNQAKRSWQDLDELIMTYRGRDLMKNREAVDILIKEQRKSLQEVKENIVYMRHDEIDLDGKVLHLKEEIGHLNETIDNLERPIHDFDSMKPNIHGSADPSELEAFLSGSIEYLSMLERITIMREMTYTKTIFFDALEQNDGQINERLFNQLILRLPKSLRDACERTRVRYKEYRCVLSKRKLWWTKHGGMDKASVTRFLKDLEAETFQVESWYSSNIPDPGRFGYEIEMDERAMEESGDGEEMQQHMSAFETSDEDEDEEDEEDIEEKRVFIITSK